MLYRAPSPIAAKVSRLVRRRLGCLAEETSAMRTAEVLLSAAGHRIIKVRIDCDPKIALLPLATHGVGMQFAQSGPGYSA